MSGGRRQVVLVPMRVPLGYKSLKNSLTMWIRTILFQYIGSIVIRSSIKQWCLYWKYCFARRSASCVMAIGGVTMLNTEEGVADSKKGNVVCPPNLYTNIITVVQEQFSGCVLKQNTLKS